MPKRFSTGLRNAMLGLKPSVTGTNIAFVNATKTITHAGNGLAVFQPGDILIVTGAAQGANNKHVTVVTVAASGASLTVNESLTEELAGATVVLTLANSRAFKDIFRNCVIEFYTGAQPASANDAETGQKLLRLTSAGGAFTPGEAGNGLNFGTPSGGEVAKASAETWVGAGLATGTAGWFRCYSNLYATGQSETAIRFDGAIGVSGAQINLSTVSIRSGQNVTIDTFQVTLPM